MQGRQKVVKREEARRSKVKGPKLKARKATVGVRFLGMGQLASHQLGGLGVQC